MATQPNNYCQKSMALRTRTVFIFVMRLTYVHHTSVLQFQQPPHLLVSTGKQLFAE